MKKTLKYSIVFILLISSYFILLLFSSLFPSSMIEKSVKESADILLKEGGYYSFSKYFNVTNDNYSDVIMINEAYSIDCNDPIYSFLSARKNYKEGLTTNTLNDINEELISISAHTDEKYYSENSKLTYLEFYKSEKFYDPMNELCEFLGGKITTSIEYARYWHGYLVILRPLLLFFNVLEIRLILLITFVILLILLAILLNKKFGKSISYIFVFSLISFGYLFVAYSLQNAPIFLVMMISCIYICLKMDSIKDLPLFFFIIASISNFVDYLTVPLISLCMPLIIYILYLRRENKYNLKDTLLLILRCSISWIIGYAITWMIKWFIFDLLYNRDLIYSAFQQVLYRTFANNYRSDISLLEAFKILGYKLLLYTTVYIFSKLTYIFIISNKCKIKIKNLKECAKNTIPFIILILYPIIWSTLLSNHTVLHLFFIYRHMIIVLTSILICLRTSYTIEKKSKE